MVFVPFCFTFENKKHRESKMQTLNSLFNITVYLNIIVYHRVYKTETQLVPNTEKQANKQRIDPPKYVFGTRPDSSASVTPLQCFWAVKFSQ